MMKRKLGRNLIVAIVAIMLLGAVLLLIGAPKDVSAAQTTIEYASGSNFNLDYHTLNNAFTGSVDGSGRPLSWPDGQDPVLTHVDDIPLQSGLTIGIYGWGVLP